MTMHVVKLDRRYDGWQYFSHRIEFSGRDRTTMLKQWIRARNWLWNQFGPSSEQFCARADFFNGVQPLWAWDSEKSSIYLQQEAYTLFILKKEFWENEENL